MAEPAHAEEAKFAEENKPTAPNEPVAAESVPTSAPLADIADPVKADGAKTEKTGEPASTTPESTTPEAAPAASGDGAAAPGAPAPAPEPKTYTFKVGESTVSIADDGSKASLTTAPAKLWSTMGPSGQVKLPLFSIGIPIVASLNVGVTVNYRLQLMQGNLSGVTVQKEGSSYKLSGSLSTGFAVGFGVGAYAAFEGGVWILKYGAGISGSAQVGGNAAVNVPFEVKYNSASGQLTGAADILTSAFQLPVTAQVDAFAYIATLKKSWKLVEAKLGAIKVSDGRAGISYNNGQVDFTKKIPSFGWDSSGASCAFFGG